jgi:hypothetical protein
MYREGGKKNVLKKNFSRMNRSLSSGRYGGYAAVTAASAGMSLPTPVDHASDLQVDDSKMRLKPRSILSVLIKLCRRASGSAKQ